MIFELSSNFFLGHHWTVGLGGKFYHFTPIFRGVGGQRVLLLQTQERFDHLVLLDTLILQAGIKGVPVKLLWLVSEISDLIQGTQLILRVAVTIQTPAHAVRLSLLHHFHLVDLTMTILTGDTAINVNRVVKVGEVRSPVNLGPLNGNTRFISIANHCQLFALFLDLTLIWTVTVVARLIRRNVGMAGDFHEGMAVATIQAYFTDVLLVREGHGLRRLISHAVILRREVVSCADDCTDAHEA